jgi:hypothetical protein
MRRLEDTIENSNIGSFLPDLPVDDHDNLPAVGPEIIESQWMNNVHTNADTSRQVSQK